jgi:hypothetical protein
LNDRRDDVRPGKNVAPMSAKDTAAAFNAGDYCSAALNGDTGRWQHHAARGLLGRHSEAISALAGFDGREAQFHRAALHWIVGDDDEAAKLLETLDLQHARNLLRLIRKRRIDVLAQLPWARGGPTNLHEGITYDDKFRVHTIGFEDNVRNEPNADIHTFYDRSAPPDFYLCNMVEWQMIPTNIRELPAPLIGHTSDLDVHIQGIYPWLRVFDELMVCDHVVEYPMLRKLTASPVSTFVRTFSLPFDLQPAPAGPRNIDTFLSGTIFSSYQPDKALLAKQLLEIPDIDLVFVSGHMAGDDYFDVLKHSKITPCFCRHTGGMLTRAMEALSMGSIALVHEGSVHTLWAGEEDGVFTYDQAIGPAPEIRRILADYPRYERGLQKAQTKIREEYEPKAVASQYFRYCAYLAARPRGKRRDTAEAPYRKRVAFWRGWVPGNGDPAVLDSFCKTTSSSIRQAYETSGDPSLLNDAARELALTYSNLTLHPTILVPDRDKLEHALELYREGIRRFPDRLVLRFNFIRITLHFGTDSQVSEGVALARETVLDKSHDWDVAFLDDVFPYDWGSLFFDYRSYLDEVIAGLGGEAKKERLVELILASIFHYLARVDGDVMLSRRAAELNPEFPYFSLTHASLLLATEGDRSREAHKLLDRMRRHPLVLDEAFWIQIGALRRAKGDVEALSESAELVARLNRDALLNDAHVLKVQARYFRAQRLALARNTGPRVDRLVPRDRPLVSIVLADSGGGGANLVRALAHQTLGRGMFQIIHAETFGAVSGGLGDQTDIRIACGQDETLPHVHLAFNAGLDEADGEIVLFLDCGLIDDLAADTVAKAVSLIRGATIPPEPGLPAPAVLIPGHAIDGLSPFSEPCWAGLACYRADAIRSGGYDQCEYFFGRLGGAAELAWRLANIGHPLLDIEAAPIDPAPLIEAPAQGQAPGRYFVAHRLWPHLFEPHSEPVMRDPLLAGRPFPDALPQLVAGEAATPPAKTAPPLGAAARHSRIALRALSHSSGTLANEIERTGRASTILTLPAVNLGRRLAIRFLSPRLQRRLRDWYRRGQSAR